MKMEKPVHLLLRFSDSLLKQGDTIHEHNQVIAREGAVWFGKMGSPVSQNHIDTFNKQVEKDVPTFVYLVKGNRRKSKAYRGNLVLASKKLPDDEKYLVPAYYADLDTPKYVKFWVKLNEIVPIDLADLNKMQVASSVLPIAETLAKSSSGHFIITKTKQK
jgi:hypothetical protein